MHRHKWKKGRIQTTDGLTKWHQVSSNLCEFGVAWVSEDLSPFSISNRPPTGTPH